jgi:hypothetical protein
MKALILAALIPCTLAAQAQTTRNQRDRYPDDGVSVGRFYSEHGGGYTYIVAVDPQDGTGISVSVGDRGDRHVYLVTPSITVEAPSGSSGR